jgi:tetratricopeptide (TPR) repeat protein
MEVNEYCPSCKTKLPGIPENVPHIDNSEAFEGDNQISFSRVFLIIVIIGLIIIAYFLYGSILSSQYYNEGQNSVKQRNYTEALASYDKAIAINPNYADAWNKRGLALSYLNRKTEAIESLDKALSLDPNDADAWSNRGLAQGKEEGLSNIDRALGIDPNFADAWTNRGILLVMLDRDSEAVVNFDKAISLKPSDEGRIWWLRGISLLKLCRPQEAVASFDRATAIDPRFYSESLRDLAIHGKCWTSH